uniref:Uncharacterized protein n=1 Tax=Sphaerodactylus townsendi TaxID=933632 RepID=A0ACB8EUZ1_9SAUR
MTLARRNRRQSRTSLEVREGLRRGAVHQFHDLLDWGSQNYASSMGYSYGPLPAPAWSEGQKMKPLSRIYALHAETRIRKDMD